jgi:lipoprotein NlpD
LSRCARGLIMLSLFWLAGCAATPESAPVREVSIASAPPTPPGQYRIQRGDTLYKIAFEHGLDYRSLAVWNNLSNPDYIRRGDLLRLTPPRPDVVAAPVARKPIAVSRSLKSEPVATDVHNIPPLTGPWFWPSQGELLVRFGVGLSKGIDIGGERGALIRAAASGKVVYVGSGLRGYGRLIIIRHDEALLSAYAHNDSILVSEGLNVMGGQVIARMGDSDAERIKLHFEIREYGKPVDPLNYLPKQS